MYSTSARYSTYQCALVSVAGIAQGPLRPCPQVTSMAKARGNVGCSWTICSGSRLPWAFSFLSDDGGSHDGLQVLAAQIIDSRLSSLCIFVATRPEIDVRVPLEPLALGSVSLHDRDGSGQRENIERYIKSAINNDARSRTWKAEDRRLEINVLT